MSRPRHCRLLQRLIALVLLACLPLGGCATCALLAYVDDEVTVAGQRKWYIRDDRPEVAIEVKNVRDVDDGMYTVVATPESSARPLIEAASGFLETNPVETLSPVPLSLDDYSYVSPIVDHVDADEGRARLGRAEVDGVSAFVEELDGDMFRVHLFHADVTQDRWVCVGVVDIGPGTQSSARLLALIATPVALAWDVYTWPIAVMIMLANDPAGPQSRAEKSKAHAVRSGMDGGLRRIQHLEGVRALGG